MTVFQSIEANIILVFLSQILTWIAICFVSGHAKRAERNSKRLNEIMEIIFREHLDAENQKDS